jgi:hypothetical protein
VTRDWGHRSVAATMTALLSLAPNVGTLGYFASFVLSPILALLALDLGRRDARLVLAGTSVLQDSQQRFRSWALWKRGTEAVAGLGGPVFAILALAHFWNPTCDVANGIFFFLLGPLCSAAIGWSAAFIAGIYGPGPRTWIFAFSPFLISLSIGLFRLYYEPVVFAFDPFWGWLSGPIYDESVGIESRYIYYRAYNLLALCGAWIWVTTTWTRLGRWRWPHVPSERAKALLALAFLSASACIFAQSDRFEFTATTASLRRALSLTRQTEHFLIYYAPGSATSQEIDLVAAEHEFAWKRLKDSLGAEPPFPIESFVFPNSASKRRLFGAGRTEVSLPWRGQIYLNHQEFPHTVLHHELAHAFGRTSGDPIFGLSLRYGLPSGALIEGFASALAPRSVNGLDLHDQASALDRLDQRPPLGELMSLGFWTSASSRAYTAAGSFCQWLLETRGGERLLALYRSGGDFDAVYGENLTALEAIWVDFLRARNLDQDKIDQQTLRFRRPSVFSRPCAHRASLVHADFARALESGDYAHSTELARELCNLEPDEYRHQLALATSLILDGREQEAYTTAQSLLGHVDLAPQERAPTLEFMGDIRLIAGDFAQASEHYRAALDLGVLGSQRRALQLRLFASRIAGEDRAFASLLIAYFAPFGTQARSEQEATLRVYAASRIAAMRRFASIGEFLLGRQLLNAQAPADAAVALERAVFPPSGSLPLPSDDLVEAAREGLLSALTQIQQYDQARLVLTTMVELDANTSGSRLDLRLWHERIDFYASYFADPARIPQAKAM